MCRKSSLGRRPVRLKLDHVHENIRADEVVLAFSDYLLIHGDFTRLVRLHLNVSAVHTAHVLNVEVSLWSQELQDNPLDVSGQICYRLTGSIVKVSPQRAKQLGELEPGV